MTETAKPQPRRRALPLAGVGVLAVVAVAIIAALWLSNASPSGAAGCAPNPTEAAAIDKAALGDLAALNTTAKGRGYADLPFEDQNGKPVTLKDFAGKTLLVNFWASWCIPCRAEMPSLAAIAKAYDGPDFMVLPINLDAGDGGLDKARAFLSGNNITGLPLYADPTLRSLDRLKDNAVGLGLPTTLLLDRKACELAVLQGPAEWDSDDGKAVVSALKGLKG